MKNFLRNKAIVKDMHSDFMIDALRLAAEESLLDQASMRVDLSNMLKHKNK